MQVNKQQRYMAQIATQLIESARVLVREGSSYLASITYNGLIHFRWEQLTIQLIN